MSNAELMIRKFFESGLEAGFRGDNLVSMVIDTMIGMDWDDITWKEHMRFANKIMAEYMV